MSTKQWLLNHEAITQAKKCISLIDKQLGIRLKLTHPHFLDMIKDYAELTESEQLQQSYAQLALLAGVDGAGEKSLQVNGAQVVVNMPYITPPTPTPVAEPTDTEDYIVYRGKSYPRLNAEGLVFKGLYRGQPRYG